MQHAIHDRAPAGARNLANRAAYAVVDDDLSITELYDVHHCFSEWHEGHESSPEEQDSMETSNPAGGGDFYKEIQ